MASTSWSHDHEAGEEEYVLLDLDGVFAEFDIPPNAPYVLSGLDTLKPTLVIDNKLRLVGEYEETIGACFVFSESDATPVVHEETGPSEANLLSGKCMVDPKQTPAKQVEIVACLNKTIKFRLSSETGIKDAIQKDQYEMADDQPDNKSMMFNLSQNGKTLPHPCRCGPKSITLVSKCNSSKRNLQMWSNIWKRLANHQPS